MSRLSAKLRQVRNRIVHWCPACRELHAFSVGTPNSLGAMWIWNGDVLAPTFSPSMHISCNWPGDETDGTPASRDVCHYFLRGGVIEFLNDCTHQLAGQTVPLPDLPD